jgi:hypothetical protein
MNAILTITKIPFASLWSNEPSSFEHSCFNQKREVDSSEGQENPSDHILQAGEGPVRSAPPCALVPVVARRRYSLSVRVRHGIVASVQGRQSLRVHTIVLVSLCLSCLFFPIRIHQAKPDRSENPSDVTRDGQLRSSPAPAPLQLRAFLRSCQSLVVAVDPSPAMSSRKFGVIG